MRAGVIPVATLATALLCVPGASADQSIHDRSGSSRSGVTLGGGVGIGEFGCTGDCDGFTEAFGVNLHVGGMIAPNLALVADLWGMAHTEDRVTLTHSLATGAVRFWPVRRLWLQGGVGFARATFSYDAEIVDLERRSDNVPGYMGAVGLELISTPSLALDVQLRAGTGLYDDDVRIRNLAMGVGVSWF